VIVAETLLIYLGHWVTRRLVHRLIVAVSHHLCILDARLMHPPLSSRILC